MPGLPNLEGNWEFRELGLEEKMNVAVENSSFLGHGKFEPVSREEKVHTLV
jgi:hypothetical protein